ncbi:hypothetical protein [Dishui Lake large algae virus 1]|nr:hypothetical protein [Dishui Lake large algae virus 1]
MKICIHLSAQGISCRPRPLHERRVLCQGAQAYRSTTIFTNIINKVYKKMKPNFNFILVNEKMDDLIKEFAAVTCDDNADETKKKQDKHEKVTVKDIDTTSNVETEATEKVTNVETEATEATESEIIQQIVSTEETEVTSNVNENDKKCLFNLDNLNELKIDDFIHKDLFIKVCDVLNDNTKRKTSIQFVPVISKELWNNHSEWVYIFTCDKNIVKIGGTRTGLKNRTQSYLCGRPEFRKKGTCSTTNYIIYNSFNKLLGLGHTIEMWACSLKEYMIDVENFGMKLQVPVQTYHVFEAKMLELYKKQKGHFPVLSNNADHRFIT